MIFRQDQMANKGSSLFIRELDQDLRVPNQKKMVGSFHVKPLQSLHVFSMKAQVSSPGSMKIKTLIHSHILHHLCHLLRTLAKAKSMFMQLLKKSKHNTKKTYYLYTIRKKNKFISSFRMHYNWCSSHVTPMPDPVGELNLSHDYYDSTWNSTVPTEEFQGQLDAQLSGYLQWLEEKQPEDCSSDGDIFEIDELADKFIASCHEKFRLEKQESYRRYQEMLARSL